MQQSMAADQRGLANRLRDGDVHLCKLAEDPNICCMGYPVLTTLTSFADAHLETYAQLMRLRLCIRELKGVVRPSVFHSVECNVQVKVRMCADSLLGHSMHRALTC